MPTIFNKQSLWFTYGPSTDSESAVESVLLAGANGCRLTFSYGTCELQQRRALMVQGIASRMGRDCAVIADIAGEKIRVGDFQPRKVNIKTNEIITLCRPNDLTVIDSRRFSVTSNDFFEHVKVGDAVVFGDGTLSITVVDLKDNVAYGVATQDGEINSNRGLIVPGKFNPVGVSNKDISDLEFIVRSGAFDALAISFVSDKATVSAVRSLITKHGGNLPIIAKIETSSGIQNLDEIADSVDAIMAARGDLALTMDWLELPDNIQKIATISNQKQKPWILATQIVEGLEEYVLPYRSEICDLAQWLKQNAGVMLARETAYGINPARAVATVAKMIKRYQPRSLPIV